MNSPILVNQSLDVGKKIGGVLDFIQDSAVRLCKNKEAVQKEGGRICRTPQVALEELLRPYLWRYVMHNMLFLDSP